MTTFNLHFVLTNLRGIVIVTPWLLHLLATDVLLSLLLPLSFVAPTAAYHISSRLADLVWRGIQFIFTRVNGAQISVSGTPLPPKESAIVVSNHVSWADFYLIQHLAIGSFMLSRCRYFAKQQLKWVPFLGWGLWVMGMPLISRRWNKDQKELDRVFRGPKVYQWPIWLISYSEATRYTAQKYLETVQWCQAHGKPIPRYTLYPRTKGFVTAVKALGTSSSVKAVYDLTLAYAHQGRFFEAPEMWETLSRGDLNKDWRFHVHAERFDIAELAGKSDEELASWLEGRWMAKSALLQELKRKLEDGQQWSGHESTFKLKGN
ncbi:uncharacterized protein Z518_09585 [Rhinocladiella mackenziei CBS 650.93]|uniref:Phospholipid/glycerol acyltransferase domain-containing protein n=1 Tax=Rhinocladiella mackenziei CBS 650.93 TaxID=1442369 RepID=A0A0D2GU56_9EURO|nr:uncharacterized protein Z518_09585 [Rhinocladiella mackenziei CBS 650.93]KIX01858.1 hypothetical protein Z518_09585 [Rhinocladiella mackenziei CBS 650.93]